MATENPLNYVNHDFDDIVADLENRLRATDAWKDTYESSTGQTMIQLFSYVAQMVLYYISRQAEECFWGTAQRKSSLVNMARLINYTPKRRISATGSLQFAIPTASSNRIYISQYTEAQTSNAVKFVTIRDTTIEPGQLNTTITAIQGELVELSFVGTGIADQELSVDDTYVENDDHDHIAPFTSSRVIVDGVEWTKVTSFLSSDNTDTHFKIRAELDDTLTILFGDDIQGKAPPNGSVILVKYIRSDGSAGNVYSTAQVTTLNSAIYDELAAVVSDVTVSNTTNMSGGDDAEDIEEIRDEAPDVFATGDRLVTRNDFLAYIINYGSVAAVNVWGENEETPPNYDMFNTIRIAILLDDWNQADSTFKDTLANDIYLQSLLTVKYEFIDPTILNVVAEVEIYVNSGYSLSQAQADVEEALADEFDLGVTTDLGQDKYHSTLVQKVNQLVSVSYHHMTLWVKKNLTASFASGYDYGTTMDAAPVLAGTVEVFAYVSGVETLMARDDGAGGLTDLSGPYVVTGIVDYTTGVINVEFEPDTFIATPYVRYQQDYNGDIIADNNQISKLEDVEVDILAYAAELP
jgi:hypothetical protein